MSERKFEGAKMPCIGEGIHAPGDAVALKWRAPLLLRGCGFSPFGRKHPLPLGYWDTLPFLKTDSCHRMTSAVVSGCGSQRGDVTACDIGDRSD